MSTSIDKQALRKTIQIEFSVEERSRRVVSRSNHRVTGKYPGFKSQRMHYWESHLERDAFILADGSLDIQSFAEQPAIIRYGKALERTHYPDILINYGHHQEFIEVKTDEDAESDEIASRTRLLTKALKTQGYDYRVWKESEIRKYPIRINNLRYLLRFGRSGISLQRFEWFRQLLSKQCNLPWAAIVGKPVNHEIRAGLCRLILEGWLKTDLFYPIFDDTIVTVGRI